VCEDDAEDCELVAEVAPWLDGRLLSETLALDVATTDDLVVEAFLTLPANGGETLPLLALPHGGPIGVSDDRYFSSEVQWLAHNGYAVLQVNYRGSRGYGEEFKNAGLRQWGRGIEDDIEAAVRRVLADYPRIDADRVGVFGGSYGGYSAVMSVIRNPELFKCAASYAGVMDLTLLFTQSELNRTDYLRETLSRYVGDPEVDQAEQMEHSPVYRYRDIKRPVLLGHGMEDTIVDVEHSWRLRKMLFLAGADPEFILLDGVGHGFRYVDDARDFYEPLLAFLDTHLKADASEPAPSPD
jgi:dipeptidyl aminopeptidase/acylaminoacyl peptidase